MNFHCMSHVHAFPCICAFNSIYFDIFELLGIFLIVSLSPSLYCLRQSCLWHQNVSLLRPKTLFVLGHLRLLILLLLISSFVMRMLERLSRRTFLDEAFILNAKSSQRTLPTPTYPMSFTVGVGSHCVTSRSIVHPCRSRSFISTCVDLIFQYLILSLAFEVRALLSHRRLLQMCFVSLGQSFLTTQVVSV